jgi:hypothetical protein
MIRYFTAAATLALCGAASISSAQTYYYPTYNVLDNAPNPITNICMFWEAPSQGYGPGIFWGLGGTGITAAGDGQTTSMGDLGKPVYPDGVLLTGVYNDAEGQHLVLFENPATATASENIDFDTLFPNSNETQLIADMENLTNGVDWNDSLNDMFGFVTGDASNIPNGGSTLSAWLTPAANGLPTQGTIEMWSTGTQIGTFTTSIVTQTTTPSPAAAIPFAISAIGLIRRRAKRSS